MSPAKQPQILKPATAAQKLGVLLSATPAEFQADGVTREQLNALLESPPEWLVELRLHGPHPRQVVAGKLGISTSGLARAGVTEALTTQEIKELLADPPEWLVRERATQAAVREEQRRVRERDAAVAQRGSSEGSAAVARASAAPARGDRTVHDIPPRLKRLTSHGSRR